MNGQALNGRGRLASEVRRGLGFLFAIGMTVVLVGGPTDLGAQGLASSAGNQTSGPFCARVGSFAMGPSPLDGYLTARGRLYASRDGWRSWRQIDEPLASVFGATVEPDPENSLRIYYVPRGNGARRSDDGGASWTAISRGLDDVFVDDLIAPAGVPDLVYAVGSVSGVYRSRNAGETWKNVTPSAVAAHDNYLQFFAHPSNPSRLWLETLSSGIWISNDSGDSWRSTNAGLPEIGEFHLAIDPTSPDIAYGADLRTLYRTEDAATWTEVARIPLNDSTSLLSLVVLPANVILAGQFVFEDRDALSLLRSLDGGETWEATALRGENVWEVVHLPEAGGVMALTESGALFSTDLGDSWTRVGAGTNAGSVGALAVGGGAAPLLLAGVDECQTGGVALSADGGASWHLDRAFGPTLDVGAVAIASSDSSKVFAGGAGTFAFSRDGGATWTNLGHGDGFPGGTVVEIAVRPTDPKVVFVATYGEGLARSKDGGETWESDLVVDEALRFHYLESIAIAPHDAALLFVGSETGGAARSIDGGETWEILGEPSADGRVSSLAFDPADPETVLAGISSLVSVPESIFRTTDGGETWEPYGVGLAGSVESVAFDPRANGLVLATVGGRLYRSTDHGANWALFSQPSLPEDESLSEVVVADDGTAFVGSHGRGVFRVPAEPEPCVAGPRTACLLGGKFKVEGEMWTAANPPRQVPVSVMSFPAGRAESDQSVFFESFAEGNFEVGVKMVDACHLPVANPLRNVWAFFGGLTSAETKIDIEDTVTGALYQWRNEPRELPLTVGDTRAFPCGSGVPVISCEASLNQACLLAGRYRVSGTMRDFSSPPQDFPVRVMEFPAGRAESDQSVFFESFAKGNFEVGVKMVDACGLAPGHPLRAYWAFYGGLTNTRTVIRITQMTSEGVNEWFNPEKSFPRSAARTQAFPCED